jgi:hypothetical protein
VSEPSLYAGRRTLAGAYQAGGESAFVPVMLVPPAASGLRITIELRGGRLVHLPESMKTERVVELLRGLEAGGVTP